MEVILLQTVPKLGSAGEVKHVSDGYFRNFLLPRGLARKVTPGGLKEAERIRERAVRQQVKEREDCMRLVEAVKKEPLVVLRKATEEGHLFGSVSEKDIADLFLEKGYALSEEHIVFKNPIKALGSFPVTIRLGHDIEESITITVERGE